MRTPRSVWANLAALVFEGARVALVAGLLYLVFVFLEATV